MSATAIPTFAVPASQRRSVATDTSRPVTWPMYTTLFASTCIVIGLIWDISWHRTVGRDTFWTYPHLLEQIAAMVTGFSCGWLVLHTTFARSAAAAEARAGAVKIWGFYGPLGAWVCIWGTVMMITSAPFDNWWHNAYGLDVKIISPPHMVLAAGMITLELGALLVALAMQNRSAKDSTHNLGLPFAYGAGLIMCMVAILIMEQAGFVNEMHSAFFYKLIACVIPFPLIAFARASSLRWPATTIAAVYMGAVLSMMWILQLFPATPKLAPIYNPVTHMVPPPFPYLLIVPAFFVDLLMHRFGRGRDWVLSLVVGVTFLASFFVVHWFFSSFMLTPAAHNFFFASDMWDYNVRQGPWHNNFWRIDRDAHGLFSPTILASGLLLAAVYSVIASRAGLWLGTAMRQIKR